MQDKNIYPIALHLVDAPVLVVGFGQVGRRKITALLEAGALVTACDPKIYSVDMDSVAGLTLHIESYTPDLMTQQHWRLVFACTNSAKVNAQIQADAAQAGWLCCRTDAGEEGDFHGMATTHADGITLAVSTSAPALSSRIRDQLADHIDPTTRAIATAMPTWRAMVLAAPTQSVRIQRVLRTLASSEFEGFVRSYGIFCVQGLLEQWVSRPEQELEFKP